MTDCQYSYPLSLFSTPHGYVHRYVRHTFVFVFSQGGHFYSKVDIMLEYGPSKWTLNKDFGLTQKATLNKNFDKFSVP